MAWEVESGEEDVKGTIKKVRMIYLYENAIMKLITLIKKAGDMVQCFRA